jgi:hypothetical protein
MPYLALGPCWACGNVMEFSPTRVPSIVVGGVRQPLCPQCVERANELRAAMDPPQPLIVVLPGAYGPDEDGAL